MYLIDTVVLSELRKPQRDARLTAWVARQRTTDLFVSVITMGEIERGIAQQRTRDPNFAAALAVPGVRLHLYEKHTPRAGRKMGHLTALASDREEALRRVLAAREALG